MGRRFLMRWAAGCDGLHEVETSVDGSKVFDALGGGVRWFTRSGEERRCVRGCDGLRKVAMGVYGTKVFDALGSGCL